MKIKINKKEKVSWKLKKTPVEVKEKQVEMNTELETRKNFQKVKELPPKLKQPAKIEKALKRIKNTVFFQKKFFRYLKEITKFLNEVLKSEASRQS